MRIIALKFVILCISVLSTIPAVSPLFAYGSAGTSGAAFLELPVGSRPISMGEAYTAATDDVSVLYYNPAGIATLQYPVLSLFHDELILDSRFENVTAALPFYKGYFAFSSSMFWLPPFDKVDVDGNTTGKINFYNSSNTFAYARDVGPIFAGISAKYIYQRIDTLTTNSFAVDVGILRQMYMYSPFPTPVRNFSIGLSALNLGTKVKDDPLPRMARFGISYMPIKWAKINADMTESMIRRSDFYDFTYGFEESFRVNTGLELNWNDMLYLRGGYRFNDAGKYSFGVGFNYAIQNVSFTIDSSYSDNGIFGPVYSVNVGFKLIPKVITTEDKRHAERYYQDGIRAYVADDVDTAIQSFKTSRDYNPYQKNIEDKIKDLEELKNLKEKNQKYEDQQNVPDKTRPR
jgi:hypothetical protein